MNKVARYGGIKVNNNITKQPGYIYTSADGMVIVNELYQVKQFYDKDHMPQGEVYVAGEGINVINNVISVNNTIAKNSDISIAINNHNIDANAHNNLFNNKADLINGQVPASQLPSYVDDILEYETKAEFPENGESGKIYVAKTGDDANKTFRWTGSTYLEVSKSIGLGQTADTAFPGNRGKAIETDLSNKVDKIDGKGLSTNDFTTDEKNKLASLNNYDDTALTSSIVTAKEEAISSAKSTSLQIDGSNSLNKVLVISEKTTEPIGPKDIQKHKMTMEVNPVGYGIFSFNYTNSQNNTYSTSLQISSASDQIVVKSIADSTYAAKSTTLAGYGIIDAKIEEGVITLGSNSITPIISHQDISSKLDNIEINKQNEIITALSTGKVAVSGKTIGDASLGYVISGDTITNNIKSELGITDQNFSVFIGRHNGGTIYPNFNCDLVYLHTNGYALHRYLQEDQNEWKTYKSDNATDGIFKYNVTEENQDGESAQLLIDQLPTTYGVVGAAGTDEKNNTAITGSFILKIKTLSDNVIHEFEIGLIYSDKVVATEKAVEDQIVTLKNNLPTKLSQFTNDVPYLTQTCLPFPDDLIQYAYPDETSTTLAFCQAFENLDLAKQGRIYLGQIGNLSDMPFPGNAECMITVCEDDVFTLEMFSTTTPCYHWIATYPGTVGDSNLVCPWKGNLTCPVTTIADSPIYTPLSDYDGATKKYVDDKIGDINTILDNINGQEL